MYCEEIDWAWRIHQAGWRVLCVPAAHVVHLGGQSTGQIRARSVLYLWESRLLLFRKYYPVWKLWAARQLIRIGMRCKIREARRDATLTEADRADLIAAYMQIMEAAQ